MLLRCLLIFSFLYSSFAYAEEKRVLGIGSATIDLLIQVSDEFLLSHISGKKGGGCQGDAATIQSILKGSGTEAKVVSGGSCANTLRALAKLGKKSAFFGCVGDDPYGEKFFQDLSKSGVEGKLRKDEAIPTSHVLCMVSPEGQRTFIGCDPALDTLLPAREDFEHVEWLHMEARHFEHGEAAMRILEMAKSLNIKVSMDLSSFEIVQKHRAKLEEAFAKYIDLIFCNEDEMLELTGLPPMEGCLQLLKTCPTVVVTMGSKGCIAGSEKTAIHVPALPARALDTTGAGDFFSAGFLYGYLQGESLQVSAEIGHLLGGAIIGVIGAELPESEWEALRSRVDNTLLKSTRSCLSRTDHRSL